MIKLTIAEQKKVGKEFAENPFQDVVTIIRANGQVITVTRGNMK